MDSGGNSQMKRAIGWVAWAGLGLAGLVIVFLVYLGFFAGNVRQSAVSPDGRYIAEWREFETSSATTVNSWHLQLRKRSDQFRHSELVAEFVDKPTLVWVGSNRLLVDCASCGNFAVKCDSCTQQWAHIYSKQTEWRDVAIHYCQKEWFSVRDAQMKWRDVTANDCGARISPNPTP
jgi:hypothetical protein